MYKKLCPPPRSVICNIKSILIILLVVAICLPMLNLTTALAASDDGSETETLLVVRIENGGGNSDVTVSAEPINMTVTVPTILPASVDGYGQVSVAHNAEIQNYSQGPVKVSAIRVEAIDPWQLEDSAVDLRNAIIGSKLMQISLQGEFALTDGSVTVDSTKWPIIPGYITEDTKTEDQNYNANSFEYMVQISPQTSFLESFHIADVIFTIDWDRATAVSESKIVSIELDGDSSQPEFIAAGNTISSNLFVVKAIYDDGTTKILEPSEYSVSPTEAPNDRSTEMSVKIVLTEDPLINYNTTIGIANIYGMSWNMDNNTFTRTDNAIGLNAVAYNNTLSDGGYGSDFDDIYPWNGMKVVTMNGNSLVSIPKFQQKWTKTDNSLSLQIADHAVDGFHVSPSHADREDGKGERDVVYIGRYESASGTYKSTTNSFVADRMTISTARTEIANIGAGYYQQDFAMYWTIYMLQIVEQADFTGEDLGESGCLYTEIQDGIITGATDNLPYHTGSTGGPYLISESGHVQQRYIEDPWSGMTEFCDGIYFEGPNIYCINNPSCFGDTSCGTYVGVRPSADGCVVGFNIPTVTGFEYALYPYVSNTDDYGFDSYCFYQFEEDVGTILTINEMIFAWNYSYISNYQWGPLSLSGASDDTTVGYSIGARLQYLP